MILLSDVDNPIVETYVLNIHGSQYDNIIIPCRPTYKSVALELIKDDDEVSDSV
jgi:hypothetical protein